MMTGGQMEASKIEFFGNDPKVQKSVTVAKNVSVTKAPVLITGEAGVGKRSLGRYIHERSSRAQAGVFEVDCSQDSQTVENEILGHRTGDDGRFVKGILERANGGTLIFANIDCLEEEFQKKLYKILNELEDYDIDIRLIATTKKNLSKLVGAGRFYRGLYNLVSMNSLNLPPLRERVSDIESLTKKFISNYNEVKGSEIVITPEAMRKLLSHYWTYNLQELDAVLESACANCVEDEITEDDLEIGEKKIVNMISEEDNEGIRLMSLKEAEKLLIKKALVHTSENRTQAAKILGVSIRTLRNKINEYRNTGSSYFINLR